MTGSCITLLSQYEQTLQERPLTASIWSSIGRGLGVEIHGKENLNGFKHGLGAKGSIGNSITVVYEVGLLIYVCRHVVDSLNAIGNPGWQDRWGGTQVLRHVEGETIAYR